MPAPATPVSFEFFPPRTPEGLVKLQHHAATLAEFAPQFYSVTYGAGGSTHAGTQQTIAQLRGLGFDACPHISCVGTRRETVVRMLEEYAQLGVRRVVALRGDFPSGTIGGGDFTYASDLVQFIRDQVGDDWHIEVAAYPEYHPQARSPDDDLEALVHKFAVGANSAITQFFYNADAYEQLLERLARRGVTAPVAPGIMPITQFAQLDRFAASCGAELPRWLRQRLLHMGDDLEAIRSFGQDVVVHLCRRLIALGAPSLHFYTLNGSAASAAIIKRLRSRE